MKKLFFSLMAAVLCVSIVAQEAPVRYLRITKFDKTEVAIPVSDIDSIDFITKKLDLEGHDYVDLGLPSGTLWATCNVGATKPEEYGNYYAWGETATKESYYWDTYKYGNASDQLTKYCTDAAYGKDGFTDNKTILDLEDDAAHVNWGGAWRMPTREQWQELNDNCTWEWTTLNGINGYKVTAANGKYLFLPAAGYRSSTDLYDEGSHGLYWSATLYSYGPNFAYYLNFYEGYHYWDYSGRRYYGYTVRPVVSKQ